jgi:hypothetical protein
LKCSLIASVSEAGQVEGVPHGDEINVLITSFVYVICSFIIIRCVIK